MRAAAGDDARRPWLLVGGDAGGLDDAPVGVAFRLQPRDDVLGAQHEWLEADGVERRHGGLVGQDVGEGVVESRENGRRCRRRRRGHETSAQFPVREARFGDAWNAGQVVPQVVAGDRQATQVTRAHERCADGIDDDLDEAGGGVLAAAALPR